MAYTEIAQLSGTIEYPPRPTGVDKLVFAQSDDSRTVKQVKLKIVHLKVKIDTK